MSRIDPRRLVAAEFLSARVAGDVPGVGTLQRALATVVSGGLRSPASTLLDGLPARQTASQRTVVFQADPPRLPTQGAGPPTGSVSSRHTPHRREAPPVPMTGRGTFLDRGDPGGERLVTDPAQGAPAFGDDQLVQPWMILRRVGQRRPSARRRRPRQHGARRRARPRGATGLLDRETRPARVVPKTSKARRSRGPRPHERSECRPGREPVCSRPSCR